MIPHGIAIEEEMSVVEHETSNDGNIKRTLTMVNLNMKYVFGKWHLYRCTVTDIQGEKPFKSFLQNLPV